MYTRPFDIDQDSLLKDLLRVIRKRVWIIALMLPLFVGAAVGFSLLQTPTYVASAKLLVGQTPQGSERSSSLGSDIQGLQQATQTVVVAVNSKPVAESVARQLDLQVNPEVLLGNLSTEQVQATQFIQLDYSDADPDRAREIVNTIGDVAAKRITESSAGASGVQATVWEYAAVPETPVGPDPLRNGILALGLGLILGIGLTFLLEYLDDTWRSSEEVEQVSGVPNFGVIPKFSLADTRGGN